MPSEETVGNVQVRSTAILPITMMSVGEFVGDFVGDEGLIIGGWKEDILSRDANATAISAPTRALSPMSPMLAVKLRPLVTSTTRCRRNGVISLPMIP